jgi:hypothetical protein
LKGRKTRFFVGFDVVDDETRKFLGFGLFGFLSASGFGLFHR